MYKNILNRIINFPKIQTPLERYHKPIRSNLAPIYLRQREAEKVAWRGKIASIRSLLAFFRPITGFNAS